MDKRKKFHESRKRTSPKVIGKSAVRSRREFKVLEDSRDLSFLSEIAADGTRQAYLRAVEAADAIVELQNGKIIRRRKDGTVEEISKLDPRREVQKGKTITLR